jgi:hypothetical protein
MTEAIETRLAYRYRYTDPRQKGMKVKTDRFACTHVWQKSARIRVHHHHVATNEGLKERALLATDRTHTVLCRETVIRPALIDLRAATNKKLEKVASCATTPLGLHSISQHEGRVSHTGTGIGRLCNLVEQPRLPVYTTR